jgi:hypothetical protein
LEQRVALFESTIRHADVGADVRKHASSLKAGAKSNPLTASFEQPEGNLIPCHARDQNKIRRIIEKEWVPKQAERDQPWRMDSEIIAWLAYDSVLIDAILGYWVTIHTPGLFAENVHFVH